VSCEHGLTRGVVLHLKRAKGAPSRCAPFRPGRGNATRLHRWTSWTVWNLDLAAG